MAPRNANFQPQQSIRPKAIDEPKRFISNNASKAPSPSGKLPVGRLRDCYLPQINCFSISQAGYRSSGAVIKAALYWAKPERIVLIEC